MQLRGDIIDETNVTRYCGSLVGDIDAVVDRASETDTLRTTFANRHLWATHIYRLAAAGAGTNCVAVCVAPLFACPVGNA